MLILMLASSKVRAGPDHAGIGLEGGSRDGAVDARSP
jgi:hypothetical protein